MRDVRALDQPLHDAGGDGFLPPDVQLRLLRTEQPRIRKAEVERHIEHIRAGSAAKLLREGGHVGRLRALLALRKQPRGRLHDFSAHMRLKRRHQRERKQQADQRLFHLLTSLIARHYFTGSCTVNVVPSPRLDCTVTEPACRRTICCTMDRPRPVPPVSRERALSTR